VDDPAGASSQQREECRCGLHDITQKLKIYVVFISIERTDLACKWL